MRTEWELLPETLRCQEGFVVSTCEEWEEKRRPEIVELFKSHVYGRIPDEKNIKVTIRLVDEKESETIMNGRAVRKTVEVEAVRNGRYFCFSFVVFVPKCEEKVPVFLTICNRGIRDSDPSRGFLSSFWPAETMIARGYAAAVFRTQEVVPDYDEGFHTGFYRLFPEYAGGRSEDGFGAVGAWSWAVSRIIDYMETDQSLDETKIAVVGHSRGGKAALWTAAQDRRVAMVVASCAGNTGDAISRGNTGERIQDIVEKFGYWFCRKYATYAGREEELPVDQHMLLALAAPRLLYTSAKTRDSWADPDGQYECCIRAGQVYKLYGKKGLADRGFHLTPDCPVFGDGIGHHRRTGNHDLDEFDWNCYMDFADRNLWNTSLDVPSKKIKK